MQELVGRLTTLDPAASESLKVIAYFDALMEARAGRLALLRAAARLTGCAAGCYRAGEPKALRVAPEGSRLPDGTSAGWPGCALPGGGRVWLERVDAPHPAEGMVLERLTLAMGLLDGGASTARTTAPALVLVDARASVDERADAAERLRLLPTDLVRAIAVLPGVTGAESLPETSTRWGPVRVALARRGSSWPSGPAAAGREGSPLDLPQSWSSAVVALRTRRRDETVVHADELGAVVALVEAMDIDGAVPVDVTRVQELQTDLVTARILDALADSPSLRSAAGMLGMHHSSLQARSDQLVRTLGFDISTPHGRTRLDLALALSRARRDSWDAQTSGARLRSSYG